MKSQTIKWLRSAFWGSFMELRQSIAKQFIDFGFQHHSTKSFYCHKDYFAVTAAVFNCLLYGWVAVFWRQYGAILITGFGVRLIRSHYQLALVIELERSSCQDSRIQKNFFFVFIQMAFSFLCNDLDLLSRFIRAFRVVIKILNCPSGRPL